MSSWDTGELPAEPTQISPGGKTEIRMLPNLPSGEVTHAHLARQEISTPAYLDGHDEFFYVLAGRGEIWRKDDDVEEVVELRPQRCVSIPDGILFQYRSLHEPLVFLVVVAPRWTKDHWHEAPAGRWDPGGNSATEAFPSSLPKTWETRDLPADPDYEAPDGSEIRLLLETDVGGIAHARLAAGGASHAVVHQTVDEVWYVLSGLGDVWRSGGGG